MLPASLQKCLDMLDDLGRRLDKIESDDRKLRGASQVTDSASRAPAGMSMSIAPSLSRAAYGPSLSLGAGSADAVLAALLADPSTEETVRMKIQQMRSFS
jgi:hypothetical protein